MLVFAGRRGIVRFMKRLAVSCLLLVIGLSAGLPAAAQPQRRPETPPAPAPAPTTLDSLFGRLKSAKDSAEGRIIARQIEQRWLRGPDETATLLMARIGQAMGASAHETAIELLDSLIQLQPRWAEAFNKRATILFLMDDYDGAMRDIRTTLALEPRHFGALAGLGMILQRMGRTKAAYAAFKRALDIHPHLDEVRAATERMRVDVEGQEL